MIWPQVGHMQDSETLRVPWDSILEELENSLVAEASGITEWVPPRVEEPLPEALFERARKLAEDQSEAIEKLRTAMAEIGQELSTLSPAMQSAPALYLDVMG